jgi:hypothetical protein
MTRRRVLEPGRGLGRATSPFTDEPLRGRVPARASHRRECEWEDWAREGQGRRAVAGTGARCSRQAVEEGGRPGLGTESRRFCSGRPGPWPAGPARRFSTSSSRCARAGWVASAGAPGPRWGPGARIRSGTQSQRYRAWPPAGLPPGSYRRELQRAGGRTRTSLGIDRPWCRQTNSFIDRPKVEAGILLGGNEPWLVDCRSGPARGRVSRAP